MLDAMDVMLYAFALTAIRDEFHLRAVAHARGVPRRHSCRRPARTVALHLVPNQQETRSGEATVAEYTQCQLA
jgi:hypothetical protein